MLLSAVGAVVAVRHVLEQRRARTIRCGRLDIRGRVVGIDALAHVADLLLVQVAIAGGRRYWTG